MRSSIKKFWAQHTALAIGSIISIVMLSLFLLFQYNQSEVLKLESRWLLVTGVPLLIALIVGGYIKSFKGFGVELETSLNKAVANLDLTATEAMKHVRGDNKRSIEYLYMLKGKEKNRIHRLILIQGRPDYYRSEILNEYLHTLGGLKYIEIQNISGKFVALIPISVLRHQREIDNDELGEFIHVLEQSQILQRYSTSVITEHVTEDTGLIETLKIMRNKKTQRLVVLNEKDIFIGVLLSRVVEKRIADDVMNTPPAKAGGFRLRLKAGSIGHSADCCRYTT